jgi:hypothetical protein
MSEDSTGTKNPTATRADFTYSITPRTLIITNTGKGKKSVVEDLSAVLQKIEYWHQGSVAHLKLRSLFRVFCYGTVLPHSVVLGWVNRFLRESRLAAWRSFLAWSRFRARR